MKIYYVINDYLNTFKNIWIEPLINKKIFKIIYIVKLRQVSGKDSQEMVIKRPLKAPEMP